MKSTPFTLGVLFGNRDFFPDKLVAEARTDLLKLFGELGLEAVMLDPAQTKLGGVETHADARKCAELFRANRDRIGGVLVVLPNFGDEKGVADTLKLAGLNVPVLVQGYPDDLDRLDVIRRRDAFCGKISVCNNLRQAGIPYSLTTKHGIAAIPLSWFLSCHFPPRLVHSLLHGWMLCTLPGERLSLDGRMFASWEQDMGENDPEIGLALLLEMKARLHRLALTCPGCQPPLASSRSVEFSAGRFTKADRIARRCTGRITVGMIAREFQLHPKRVGKIFYQAYGTTLVEFVTQHRVFHAQRLLVTSDAKVAGIASESGFGSLSRFSGAFRKACGCSPREFRRRHCAGQERPQPAIFPG